ncbi:hypothetical protein EDS67_25705 [candidate division KSB1 bacterium]|nr:MAG: hypothetical protein EDS67_25705 [candidate division KSB1 bacterium]MCE7944778.1 hypothetical protein [Chlorobi bacterium CHB1]
MTSTGKKQSFIWKFSIAGRLKMLRHLFCISCLIAAMAMPLFAQQTWVPFLQQEKTAPSVTLLTSNTNIVSFTVQINGMFADEKKVGDVAYRKLSIPDAEVMTEQGLPQVPMITKLIAVPDCDDVSISVVPSNELEFANYDVIPAPRYERKEWPDGSHSMAEVFEENKPVYSSDAYFPGKYGEIVETGYVRGQKVARVAIYPIQFNPAGKTLKVFTDFNIILSFIGPSSPVNKELGIFRNMMHHVALNYELSGISASTRATEVPPDNSLVKITAGSVNRVTDLSLLVGPSAMPVDYLIITHSSLFNSSSLTTLANHRRDYDGYDVVIVQVDAAGSNNDIYDFEDSPGHIKYPSTPSTRYVSIRDFIRDVYLNGRANHTRDGHLGYILLVGDALLDDNSNPMVPANRYYTGFAEGGDYYYACTGGDSDNLQDLMYGRLSIGNEGELSAVVNKIISYRFNSNGSWGNDYTFVAFSPDLFSYADPAMEQMTEVVPPTYSKSYAYRAYTGATTLVTEANPIFGQTFTTAEYDDPYNLCGSQLLNDWLFDNADAGINNRVHTFIYEGHGRPGSLGANEGSGRVIFQANQLANRLHNDLYSFMIFNCCESGYFDKGTSDLGSVDCVAEVVTNLANEGAIGCLASTRDSYVSAFGRVDRYVLEAQYNSLSHVMGEAVMESKIRMTDLLFRRQYNLYGDPAVNLWPTGYTVSENITLSGTVDITSNIIVASGTTLTIASGANVIIQPGVTVTVNGTLSLAANLAINSEVTLTIASGGSLILNPGVTVTVSGTLSLAANASISGGGTVVTQGSGVILASNSAEATAFNNSRKIARDASGNYHVVFEAEGEICYEMLTSSTALSRFQRLSSGNGNNKYPCIAERDGKLYVVWQRQYMSTHNIHFRSCVSGSWGSVQTLATSVGANPPLPVITSPATSKLMVVYRATSNFYYRVSNNDGSSWAAATAVPWPGASDSSPALAPTTTYWGNGTRSCLVYAYNNGSTYNIYYQYYRNGPDSTEGWNTTRTNLSSIVPGSYNSHKRPSLAPSGTSGDKRLHVVWEARSGTSGNYYVIIHRKATDWGAWPSVYSATYYQEQQQPSVTGLANDTAELLFKLYSQNQIYKIHYDGSSWGSPVFISTGANPSVSVGNTSAKYVWTKGTASPYEVKTSSETLSKNSPLTVAYHRSIAVIDTASGAYLELRINKLSVKTRTGDEFTIPFSMAQEDTATLTPANAFINLASQTVLLPADAESLVVNCLISGQELSAIRPAAGMLAADFILAGKGGATLGLPVLRATSENLAETKLMLRMRIPSVKYIFPPTESNRILAKNSTGGVLCHFAADGCAPRQPELPSLRNTLPVI